jgi:hypothetical protein
MGNKGTLTQIVRSSINQSECPFVSRPFVSLKLLPVIAMQMVQQVFTNFGRNTSAKSG